MVNARNSRLEEIDYSQFNLRDAYITDIAEYVAALRDESLLSNFSLRALIRIPLDDEDEITDNYVDCYSNFANVKWQDTTESIIPLFKEYRENLSVHGMTADSSTDALWPLEILIPTKLHLPRNSRIILSEYDSNEYKIAREWTVLGTQMKQLSNSKTYSRVANCVPSRQTTVDSLNAEYLGTIWFDWFIHEVIKEKLRASGIIWFYDKFVAKGGLIKKYVVDEIQEVLEHPVIYLESLNVAMGYLTAPEYILDSHTGFKVEDKVPLYIEDEEGNKSPLMIAIDEDNTTVQMELVVRAVDEVGKITKYALTPNKGYSKLSQDDKLVAIGTDTEGKQVLVNLISVQIAPSELQEVIAQQEIEEKPKYITPYTMETRFIAKKVAISVLNW